MFSSLLMILETVLNSLSFSAQKHNKRFRRLLCVDSDQNYCLEVEILARSVSIQVEQAPTLFQAKQKIKENGWYDLFIIDGHYIDGCGFELIAWIRENEKAHRPIIFLSYLYRDSASFRILKEILNVDFVIEKPIKAIELINLLKKVSEKKRTHSFSKDYFNEEIRKAYKTTMIEQIERLEKMICRIQNYPSVENVNYLKLEISRIIESATLYGYPKVIKLCHQFEQDLTQWIGLNSYINAERSWLAALDRFYAEIKFAYQIN